MWAFLPMLPIFAPTEFIHFDFRFVKISFQDALDVMISCFRIGLSSTTILLKKANVNVCIKEEKLENINKNKNYRIHYNDIG